MDAKEEGLVGDLYRRIKGCTFHERDILALLILLRPHAAVGSPVRELSDFVAHREKDRGALKNYVHHVVAYVEAVAKKTAGQAKIEAVHSANAFRDSLNLALTKFRLDALANNETNGVLMCVMSLLQDVRLFHNKSEIGRLVLCKFSNELWLCGVIGMPQLDHIQIIFPALIVQNNYCSTCEAGKAGDFPGLVEARCTNGKLRLYVGDKEAI